MKRFLLIITLLITANRSHAQSWMSTVNLIPTTSLEKIDNHWTYTSPIGLSYGLMYSFTGGVYSGIAIGGGVDLNGGGTGELKLNTPAMLFLGIQPSPTLPSFFLAYGLNLSNNHEVISFGIHLTGFATSASTDRYKGVVTNDAYARDKKAGFLKPRED